MLGLIDSACRKLLEFYQFAVVPREAPEKRDHGDIDVLVDGARSRFYTHHLATSLGAIDHIRTGQTTSFAIQIPEDGNFCFQLDVRSPERNHFEWERFIYSYGGLWHIVGSIVTHFGLTIDDSGLYVRIEEIEATHEKDCRLFLTREPPKMMELLGLDDLRYDRGFSTPNELFEWVTGMPLYRRFLEESTASERQVGVYERGPMYSKFVTEWLPQQSTLHTGRASPGKPDQKNCELDVSTSTGESEIPRGDVRKDLLNRALSKFNKKGRYSQKLRNHQGRILKDAMWGKIASTLPLQGQDLDKAMAALKKSLWWDGSQPRLDAKGKIQRGRVPGLHAETVDEVLLPWIRDHWSEAVGLRDGSAH